MATRWCCHTRFGYFAIGRNVGQEYDVSGDTQVDYDGTCSYRPETAVHEAYFPLFPSDVPAFFSITQFWLVSFP